MTDHSDDFLDEDLDISVEPPIDAPGPPVIPPPIGSLGVPLKYVLSIESV